MSSTKSKRIENKRKKMAAYLEISKLNESDRANKQQLEQQPSPKRLKTLTEVNGVDPDYQDLKKMVREKKLTTQNPPAFRLRDVGMNASITCADQAIRTPLFLSDVQHLIMYSQMGPYATYSPARWCALERFNRLTSTYLLIVDNLSLNDYLKQQESFSFLSNNLEHQLEIVATNNVIKDLSMVPLTATQMKKFIDDFGSLEKAVVESDELFDAVKNLFPIDKKEAEVVSNANLPKSDTFSRTQLLLSGWQMVEENFPLPIDGLKNKKYPDYVLTKDEYAKVTPFSPMFGIDCEMCKTTSGELELTRVSIVNENLEIFYDTLVKPENKIVDYLTRFSGITSKMMRHIKTKLKDVQNDIRKLLPSDAILVGQSLANDLHALKLMHPYIIDTSVIYNLTGDRQRKSKLKTLTQEFLCEKIQEGRGGHCSTEDSLASLKLTQLKLRKHLYYGDAVLNNCTKAINYGMNYPQLGTHNYATSLLNQTTKMGKSATIIGVKDVMEQYKYYLTKGLSEKIIDEKKICCLTEKSSSGVVDEMTVKKSSLTIGHLKFQEEKGKKRKDDEIVSKYKSVDKWAKSLYENLPMPGLLIVLFTGRINTDHNSSGVCFIQCKTER